MQRLPSIPMNQMSLKGMLGVGFLSIIGGAGLIRYRVDQQAKDRLGAGRIYQLEQELSKETSIHELTKLTPSDLERYISMQKEYDTLVALPSQHEKLQKTQEGRGLLFYAGIAFVVIGSWFIAGPPVDYLSRRNS